MGKGDQRTKRGKRIAGTYGVSRKKKSAAPVAAAPKKKKAAPKKKAAAKKTADKTEE